MNDKHHTLVLGVLAAVAIGCAGPSSLKRAGSPKSGNKSGMVTATASKYTFLHMEWGNDSIGSLAHKNGIRYVLSANHHGVGLPLLGKKKIEKSPLFILPAHSRASEHGAAQDRTSVS